MGYTAVRGGLDAIEFAERLANAVPVSTERQVSLEQISGHLGLAADRVMAEGGIADKEIAALAIKQAEGDLIEAAFLVRAYRSTLQRLGYSNPVTGTDMVIFRRISSVFRDIPGGQLLGLTRDYTQRLLDFGLAGKPEMVTISPPQDAEVPPAIAPTIIDFLRDEGLIDPAPRAREPNEPFDVTRSPLAFPVSRSGWLQVLARGEAGAMLMLAYSSMRGFGGQGHGAVAELRSGELPVRISHPITGRPATIGHIRATEVHYISGGHASLASRGEADYKLGFGLVIGRDERKAISMSIIDASLNHTPPEDGQPVADQEFVLAHVDSVESSGFVEHLKLPHYVTFQAGLARTRRFKKLMEASRV